MTTSDGTCEYVLDPERPETWGGEEGDECYVDERFLNEDGMWHCPHDTDAETDHCIFHRPVAEKDDEAVITAFLDRLDNADSGDDPEKRCLEFLGAKFGAFDLSDESSELKLENGELAMSYAEVASVLNWSGLEIDESAIHLTGIQCLGNADFVSVRFGGDTDFRYAEFGGDTDFGEAEFGDVTGFNEAEFGGDTDFGEAEFGNHTYFKSVDFRGDTDFRSAQFGDDTHFEAAQFGGSTDFGNAVFDGDTDFGEAAFGDNTSFSHAEFEGDAGFMFAEFEDHTNFSGVEFRGNTNFTRAQFGEHTDFIMTEFEGGSGFRDAKFGSDTDFVEAAFGDTTYFSDVEFKGETSFRSAKFRNNTSFRRVAFGGDNNFHEAAFGDKTFFSEAEFEGDTIFAETEFEGDANFHNAAFGGNINFMRADLTDATFAGTSLCKAHLESAALSRATLFGADLRGAKLSGAILGDVRIDEDTQFLGHPGGDSDSSVHTLSAIRSRPKCVYDPDYEVDNEYEHVDKAKSVYRALEELGGKHARPRLQARSFVRRQDLQKQDYWNDARADEASLEERLIAGARWGRAKMARATLLYGESPWRVISWSLGIIVGFALLFPLGGWMKPEGGDPLTYTQIAANPIEFFNSVYYSTLTFTALGFGDFKPVGLGRALTTVETGLGAVLLALLVFILGRRAAR